MPADPAVPAAPRPALRRAIVAIALIAAAVLGGGIATRLWEGRTLRERAEADAVPVVVVHAPGTAEAADSLELPGRIEAYARAPIYARVSGYLKRWYADIGASVKAGQLLAEIETPDLDQQLLQAQAELANARANAALAATTARRWQALLATDSVSQQEVDEKAGDLAARQSQVNALQANVERYQALKRFARIEAPFDGVVTGRSTDVGALINVGSAQGSELFEVSDTSTLRVYVNVPQNYATVVGRGTKASISVPERPGQRYAATVQSLSHAISTQSGSMLVQLTADNADARLLPGGFARVRFDLAPMSGTLTIPSSALIFGKAGLRVATVAADGKVVMKPVTLARDDGATVELAAGLEPGDKVIESPQDGIANGDPVRIAAPAEPATASAHSGKPERARH
jgi:membrane fusion protein, multidrug efflux system